MGRVVAVEHVLRDDGRVYARADDERIAGVRAVQYRHAVAHADVHQRMYMGRVGRVQCVREHHRRVPARSLALLRSRHVGVVLLQYLQVDARLRALQRLV